jgi:hypothetical protein
LYSFPSLAKRKRTPSKKNKTHEPPANQGIPAGFPKNCMIVVIIVPVKIGILWCIYTPFLDNPSCLTTCHLGPHFSSSSLNTLFITVDPGSLDGIVSTTSALGNGYSSLNAFEIH